MVVKSVPKVPALGDMLCFALHSTGFAFTQVYREPLKALGLTYPQYLVMVALWSADDVTVGQLGEQLAVDTGTLTPLLKRLEAIGMVTRRRSEIDERRVMIALTDNGRALRSKAADVTQCIAESTGMPIGELKRLLADIQALRANLRRAAAEQRPIAGKSTKTGHQRSS